MWGSSVIFVRSWDERLEPSHHPKRPAFCLLYLNKASKQIHTKDLSLPKQSLAHFTPFFPALPTPEESCRIQTLGMHSGRSFEPTRRNPNDLEHTLSGDMHFFSHSDMFSEQPLCKMLEPFCIQNSPKPWISHQFLDP